MLYFRIPNIKFTNESILKNVEFKAAKGHITTIYGASGTGKSTLLNCILHKNKFYSEYLFRNESLYNKSETDIQFFKKTYLSSVSQTPEFINDLTLIENINLIQKMSHFDSNKIDKLLTYLELNLLLNKYPNELSGGERSRASLILALTKDTEILVLDEPTSSLDIKMTHKICKLLEEIKENKYIIISTHDREVLEISDRIYLINNKTLILEYDSVQKNKISIEKDVFNTKSLTKEIAYILNNCSKHNQIYMKVIKMITALLIGFSSFFVSFNNYIEKENLHLLNELSSSELLIYKPSGGYSEQGLPHQSEGNELISKQEINQIAGLDNVKEVRPRMDLTMSNPMILMVEDRNPKTRKKTYTLTLNNGINLYSDKSMQLTNAPVLNTYYSDINYSKEILLDFGKEKGIYISKMLAEYLCDSKNNFEILKDKTCTFDIFVPVYNSVGKAWANTSDGHSFWPNITSCKVTQVTLPISGILKTSNMGIKNTANYAIYVDYTILFDLANQFKEESNRISYILESNSYEYSINKVPKGKSVRREVKEEVWTAKSYTILLKDATALEKTARQISEMGFTVNSEYLNIDAANNTLIEIKNLVSKVSIIIIILIVCIYIGIKYNDRKKEENIYGYLYELGLTHKEINEINLRRYIYNTMNIMLWSFASLILFMILCKILRYGYTVFDLKMIGLCTITTIIIEFIIPILLRKTINHD